jgi:hypothetical protein
VHVSQNDEKSLYIQRVQHDVARHSQELLRENEQLRILAANLEFEVRRLERTAEEQRAAYDAERVALTQRLAEIEAESRRREREAMEVEQQHANLTNLYVASYRLHSTLDREEVLETVQEIIINLVGCEELAIFELQPGAKSLTLSASFGIDASRYGSWPVDRGRIGQTVRSGEMWVRGEGADGALAIGEQDLTACIPLTLSGRVTGAVALFRLLPQKRTIEAVDRELFELLGTHAAMALHTTSYTRWETVQ